jgi:DNA-binding beta-propeller fold protein YncE
MLVRRRLLLGVLPLALLAPAVAHASPGDLYVGDPGRHAVIRIDHRTGNQKVVASGQNLAAPDSGAFASKHRLFIADYNAFDDPTGKGGAVFRVNTQTGKVGTVSKDPRFEGPTDLAIASNGKIDTVDPFAGTGGLGAIFHVNPSSGATSLLSDDQHFNGGPLGIAILPSGKLLVTDQSAGPNDSGALLRVNPTNGHQSFVTKGGHLNDPYGLTLSKDGKTAYVSDTATDKNRIVRVKVDSGAQKVVANGGKLDDPTDVALGLDGKLYVVNDAANPKVLRIDRKTGHQKVFASGGKLIAPEGITVQPRG